MLNGRSVPLTLAGGDAIRISAAVSAATRTEWGDNPVPASGQGREIPATVGLDEDAQFGWGDHLDHIAPLIEVPGHLQPASGSEPDGQAAVGLILNLLIGVEDEGPRDIGGRGGEAPFHRPMLRFGMKRPERLRGVLAKDQSQDRARRSPAAGWRG